MKNCKDIARLIDQRDMDGLSVVQKARLKIHFMMCNGCKKYSAFSSKIHDLFHPSNKTGQKKLTPDEKATLVDKISK